MTLTEVNGMYPLLANFHKAGGLLIELAILMGAEAIKTVRISRQLVFAGVLAGLFWGLANWPRTVGLSAAKITEGGFPVVFLIALGDRVDCFSLFYLCIDILCGLIFVALVVAVVSRRSGS
jgi:hypothetical protein